MKKTCMFARESERLRLREITFASVRAVVLQKELMAAPYLFSAIRLQ